MQTIINISSMGNLGNQMFQLMAAKSLQSLMEGSVISGQGLPAWGISMPSAKREGRRVAIATEQRLDLTRLAERVRAGESDYIDIRSYCQHMDNLPLGHRAYSALFPFDSATPGDGGDTSELVINIRAGEILDARHPDYTLVPIEFYRELVRETQLRPVFCGQTEPDNVYVTRLMQTFPEGVFIPNSGPMATFAYMRRSKYLVPSISTFSWLAAWLSEAETVFLPVLGLYNPMQCRQHNFIPLGDARYHFHLFPASYAVPVAQVEQTHASLRGTWRYMTHPALRGYMTAPLRVQAGAEHLLAFFDEAFYRQKYEDVDQSIASSGFPSGRHHYEHHGMYEGREPFRLDMAWYVTRYPLAAMEIGQGDFLNPHHHFVAVGHARGYLPFDRCLP